MKIHIIGPSGGGKSYLARALAKGYGIPHIDVDQVWLKHGGRKYYGTGPGRFVKEKNALAEAIRREVEDALRKPDWIVDGSYSFIREPTLAAADLVILVDVPATVATWSILRRQLSGENKRRGYGFRDFVVHFHKSLLGNGYSRLKLRKVAESHRGKVVVLRSRRDVNEYVSKLGL